MGPARVYIQNGNIVFTCVRQDVVASTGAKRDTAAVQSQGGGMRQLLGAVMLAALAVAGPALAEGVKHAKPAKGGHGGGTVIRAECSVEVFTSVNSLDRPSEAFVEAIRAAIGPRATRGEAYGLGEAYCRHPQRLTRNGVAEADLQRDIVGMRRR